MKYNLMSLIGMLMVAGLLSQRALGNSDAPTPPSDAVWTLQCRAIAGPEHARQMTLFKEYMQKTTGLKDWYVIHGENESTLYYGYYSNIFRNVTDGKAKDEAERAQADRKRIAAWKDPQGNVPFEHSLFVQMSAPGPDGPPEWNLLNAPKDAYWSLEIGAYMNSPQRKQYAIDAVKEARAQGIEAYYYHGPNISSVCIGAFPISAIKAQESDTLSSPNDPSQTLLVLPGPLPEGSPDHFTAPDGTPIKAMAPRLDVLDPTLQGLMKKYPYHLVNGESIGNKGKNPKTGEVVYDPDPSFVVVIPHRKSSMLQASDGSTPTAPPPMIQIPASNDSAPGTTKLKSIGD